MNLLPRYETEPPGDPRESPWDDDETAGEPAGEPREEPWQDDKEDAE